MSRNILLLAIVFIACLYTVSAHRQHARSPTTPYGWHAKRAVAASTCSFMQCAVAGGSCALNGTTLIFCPQNQHCDGSRCIDNKALGSPCDSNAPENECASGKCVNNVCQIFQEIMPGNPCTEDNQCYFSESADNTGPITSRCVPETGKCFGRQVGENCAATHQCVVGTFCSQAQTCQPLGGKGAACSTSTDCNARFTCFNSVCSSRYTQKENEACSKTENCQPGLYCNSASSTCTKALGTGRTSVTCDIGGTSCAAGQECSCNGYTTQNQQATCDAIEGTPVDMPKIEQAAFDCLDQHNCGADANNDTTVQCISNNCVASYCTYFTRNVPDLFTEYPSCLVSRMVSSEAYAKLLGACTQYKPTTPNNTSGASVVSVSMYALLALLATLLIGF